MRVKATKSVMVTAMRVASNNEGNGNGNEGGRQEIATKAVPVATVVGGDEGVGDGN